MVLLMRKVAKKRSDRNQSLLRPSLYAADIPTGPNEYDEVMGITQVDSREAERFEEGIGPEFHDVEEEPPKEPGEKPNVGHVSSFSHRGYGSSSLQECLDRLNQATNITPAPCHSGVTAEKSSNPPQKSAKLA